MTKGSKQPKKTNPPVLADHKRVGSRFIPPVLQQTGMSFHALSWTDFVLPEVIWIALLQDYLGHRVGVECAKELMRVRLAVQSPDATWLATASAFGTLSRAQVTSFHNALDPLHRADIVVALGPLVRLYPKCPLAFLAPRIRSKSRKQDDLETMRRIVASLFDKGARPTVLTMATVVYLAFDSGYFKVGPDSGYKDFQSIEDYPGTEESKGIASLLRASIQALFGAKSDPASPWPKYFWNRGLQIDGCSFEDETQ